MQCTSYINYLFCTGFGFGADVATPKRQRFLGLFIRVGWFDVDFSKLRLCIRIASPPLFYPEVFQETSYLF